MTATLESLEVPGPTSTEITAPFWKGASAGKFLMQHCAVCRRWVFYPRAICVHCWSPALEWREASGEGSLTTWSWVYRPSNPAWGRVAPYAVGLVHLSEGPTMLSHILARPDQLVPDMPVRVRFVRVGEHRLPFFEPRPMTIQTGRPRPDP